MLDERTHVLELDSDIRSPESNPHDSRVARIDTYRLTEDDLAAAAGLLIGPSVDQEYLMRHQDLIGRYLDAGGVVVFGGHLSRPWLPGTAPFVPLAGRRRRDFRVVEIAEHPLLVGLNPDELTFRRGVAGFFARGHHPVPAGAEVLIRLHGGQPCSYLDRVSSAGTILVHATADLGGFLGPRLVDWVLAEAATDRDRPRGQRPSPQPASWPPAAPALRPGGGFAAVYGGSSAQLRALTHPAYARHLGAGVVPLIELAGADLSGVDGLIVPERLHRGLLTAAADTILGVLDAGGCVAAFAGGEPVPEFLPGVRWEHRPTNFWWWLGEGSALDLRTPEPGHPLFERLSLRDCTWHYHGVLDPPPGAQVLVTLASGEALLYLDEVSTPGTLVVSTLDPLSHFGGYFMPATQRFLDGFLPWLTSTVRRRLPVGG